MEYETVVVTADGENSFKLAWLLHGSMSRVSINGVPLSPNTDYIIEDGYLFFNFDTKRGDEVRIRYA